MRLLFVSSAVVAVALAGSTLAGDPPAPAAIILLPGPAGPIAFTPDGTKLVTCGADRPSASGAYELRVWDAATGKPLAGPLTGRGVGLALAVSPDGTRALTGGFDGFARLWDLGSGKSVAELQCYTPTDPTRVGGARVERVAFAPSGTAAVTVEWQEKAGLARFWDPATGKSAGEPQARSSRTAPLRFTPEGKLVPEEKAEPLPHPDRLLQVLSEDGKLAITGGADGRAVLWDSAARKAVGEPLVTPAGRNPPWVVAAAFSPDGKRVAVGTLHYPTGAAAVGVLDRETRAAVAGPLAVGAARGQGKEGGVREVAFAPNGKTLAVVVTRRGPGQQTQVSEVQLWGIPAQK